MSRYKTTKVKRNSTGDRVYKPTIYPKIDIEDNDTYIYTKENDRLDSLAYKYYRDTSLWWIIAEANGLRTGKFGLDVGIQLRIPKNVNSILSQLDKLNS